MKSDSIAFGGTPCSERPESPQERRPQRADAERLPLVIRILALPPFESLTIWPLCHADEKDSCPAPFFFHRKELSTGWFRRARILRPLSLQATLGFF